MTVAWGLAFHPDCACELAVSRFQPASQGSFPAATRTFARLSSPKAFSMPGWVKTAGAAWAEPPMAAVASVPTVPARATPDAAFSMSRRLVPCALLRLIENFSPIGRGSDDSDPPRARWCVPGEQPPSLWGWTVALCGWTVSRVRAVGG